MTSLTPDIGSVRTDLPAGTSRGSTVINDAVVAKIAGLAVREVTGVHALGGGAARALGAIRDAIGSTDRSQGVSVKVNGPHVAVDLSIVAEYPLPLQQVADDARTAIIDAIETLVGLEVTEVNVTINDVHLPDEADETDEGSQP
ncbi:MULTISPECIES: Asp23/Gls24 family envelope stress response protein [Cryobacterium]|uniref:Asp23/Gls24 family envelope stress response protein n=1 Tax=Cryobacterium zongtaii TaxID=1259217 RepID=A0A2S3ZGL0_9MICO|nr:MULTISPECIES: Asp23/Gls24 family envelope stress response protein [Cryobacterium]POH63769.1 Asp23/Gls24 family envelope stress response protein [Cryobacterium zongtaii]POH66526.1 Asp23/Gls24 family envelope stress response protein [Cryobacterium zongtaii]TFC40903.1 Asp23/Gls24 family envelope stress response protein [Cryobacterium sp. TMN-39-2]